MARPSKKAGAGKGGNPTMDFVLDYLRRKPKAEYAELKSAAEQRGHQVWPITYGRAQAMLGLIDSKPAGRKKAGAGAGSSAGGGGGSRAAAAAGPRRGPGRPRKQQQGQMGARAGSRDALAGIQAALDELQRYRQALEQIAQIAGGAVR